MIAAFAVALAAAAAPPARGDSLADLQRIWAQSCEVRAYGSFDDLCDQLRKQMREAERAQRSSARSPAEPAAAKPTPGALIDQQTKD